MLKMLNYVITVPTASDALLGREGENNARTLRVKTTDDISAYAEIHLIIGTLDCGAMTITQVGNYRLLSMPIRSDMIGDNGCKICQLIMMDSTGTIVLKSNQFLMDVSKSNDIDSAIEDSQTIVIIADYIQEQVSDLLSIDDTLTLEGHLADAAAVGAAIENLTLTTTEATALIALLES